LRAFGAAPERSERLVPDRSVHYRVTAPRPERHMLVVRATFAGDALPEPLVVSMPAWTPGSYLVREYARHVEGLRASGDGRAAGVRKVRKDAWAIAHGGARAVVVEYALYAHDLTVRTNHVDATHAYFNGAATYVRPVDEPGFDWDALPCEVELVPALPAWRVVTALAPVSDGRWGADSFHDLVDAPTDMGEHDVRTFEVDGRPHTIAVWGARLAGGYDGDRFARDVARIVEAERAMFGGLPYERYVFMVHLAPGGRGGLEHARGTSIMASLDAFESDERYTELLSLVAHEFFHLWNVKRIRPAGLAPIDYGCENYTRLLWFFEGATSYFDRRVLLRAGLVTRAQYLAHLASLVARLDGVPGRFAQTLEEASFDAWVKLYRPDEHTVNSTVSYYLKGELACAVLDLTLRARSDGERSLEDVVRWLWREHLRTGDAMPEGRFEAIAAAATGVDISDMVDRCIRTIDPLPCDTALASAGFCFKARRGRGVTLGVTVRSEAGRVLVSSVLRGGPGASAGISPGDEIIGFQSRRVDENALRERLRRGASMAGTPVSVLIARREEIAEVSVIPVDAPPEALEIVVCAEASRAAQKLADSWLGCERATPDDGVFDR
jgi:predicted metalloprotease with PDZ domain